MKKNGKTIKCKYCQKEFYISGSRIGIKKYCSLDCGFKDDFGFIARKKKCVICENEFIVKRYIEMRNKTCSYSCWKKLNYQISMKRSKEKIEKKCKKCGLSFIGLKHYISKGFCPKCRYKKLSKERIKKGNPNYKDGHATKAKFGGRRSIYTSRHMRACQLYRKNFLKNNEYLLCEICGANEITSLWFEVHHIYFASRWPRHKELHNFRNLILLCKQCHVNFHQKPKETKPIFLKLQKDRGLKELFVRKKFGHSRLFKN